MKTARLSNVLIKDLLAILNKLSEHYDIVDIIINPEDRKIIIDPIDKIDGDQDLTDDNIYKLI